MNINTYRENFFYYEFPNIRRRYANRHKFILHSNQCYDGSDAFYNYVHHDHNGK